MLPMKSQHSALPKLQNTYISIETSKSRPPKASKWTHFQRNLSILPFQSWNISLTTSQQSARPELQNAWISDEILAFCLSKASKYMPACMHACMHACIENHNILPFKTPKYTHSQRNLHILPLESFQNPYISNEILTFCPSKAPMRARERERERASARARARARETVRPPPRSPAFVSRDNSRAL